MTISSVDCLDRPNNAALRVRSVTRRSAPNNNALKTERGITPRLLSAALAS